MIDDVFTGVDDCNGVDDVKLFCVCCCCCCGVLITMLFFNDCVIVALLLFTILFKLFDVEEESRLFNVLLGMLDRRFIEGFTLTFLPMSFWFGLISRVLKKQKKKLLKLPFNILYSKKNKTNDFLKKASGNIPKRIKTFFFTFEDLHFQVFEETPF